MSHEQAQKELQRGTPAELICATCPWDRLCIEPPSMSQAEIDRKMKEAEEQDLVKDPERKALPVGTLLTALVFAGKADVGRLCPVFALRLGGPDGRQIADGLRTQMRAWVEAS